MMANGRSTLVKQLSALLQDISAIQEFLSKGHGESTNAQLSSRQTWASAVVVVETMTASDFLQDTTAHWRAGEQPTQVQLEDNMLGLTAAITEGELVWQREMGSLDPASQEQSIRQQIMSRITDLTSNSLYVPLVRTLMATFNCDFASAHAPDGADATSEVGNYTDYNQTALSILGCGRNQMQTHVFSKQTLVDTIAGLRPRTPPRVLKIP